MDLQKDYNYILTIAGLDPCSGAGVAADLKVFHSYGLYGLSVCSAITVQNESEFISCHWLDDELVIQQLDAIIKKYPVGVIKIGLVKSWESLLNYLIHLHNKLNSLKIVLDPILSSSTGFTFHESDLKLLSEVLKLVNVITPNLQELELMYPSLSKEQAIKRIIETTSLYLKGGHSSEELGVDYLYNKEFTLRVDPVVNVELPAKHGSGCVLSSALASQLALGYDLSTSCRNAKSYTEQFLASNNSLLGWHQSLWI